jgi:hypothetical protein
MSERCVDCLTDEDVQESCVDCGAELCPECARDYYDYLCEYCHNNWEATDDGRRGYISVIESREKAALRIALMRHVR